MSQFAHTKCEFSFIAVVVVVAFVIAANESMTISYSLLCCRFVASFVSVAVAIIVVVVIVGVFCFSISSCGAAST